MESMLLLVLNVVDIRLEFLSFLSQLVIDGIWSVSVTVRLDGWMSLICFDILNPLLYLILSIDPADYLPFLTSALRWHH